MELVTGVENEEVLRARAGDSFAFVVRRGFVPPSWVFVGIVVEGAETVESTGALHLSVTNGI